MSKRKRPSVSMKRDVFRPMAYAADEIVGIPRCAWVEAAIEEKLARDGCKPPPADWEPEDRRGRPPKDRVAEAVAKHFTF